MVLSIADEKKITPQAKYDKANTKIYAVKVVKTTEQDIMTKLEEQKNKSGSQNILSGGIVEIIFPCKVKHVCQAFDYLHSGIVYTFCHIIF